MYQIRDVSAFSWFWWANYMTWWFVYACARVERTMRMFYNPNQIERWPVSLISVSRLLLRENVKAQLLMEYMNKIQLSDIIWLLKRAVVTQYESVFMTAVKLHLSTLPTALLSILTCCTWLRYLKLLMICHGNGGDWAGWGMVRKWTYMNQKIVKWSRCRKLLATSGET